MTLIIYQSNYGHTKQYADWIAEELNSQAIPFSAVDPSEIESHATVIFGHSVYAGSYKKAASIRKIMEAYPDKNYIFFGVNLADTNQAKERDYLLAKVQKALGQDAYQKLKIFFFRGGIDYSKLSTIHRAMMWMVTRQLKSKAPEDRSESDQSLIEIYGGKLDLMDRQQISPLLDYFNGLSQS